MFPYNPTGQHWVLVKASTYEGRSLVVYDSYDVFNEYHEPTWDCAVKELQLLMFVLGFYNPAFANHWPVPVLAPCVKQHLHDCGVFVIDNCRSLLGDILPESEDIGDPDRLAGDLRARYLGEFRAMLEGNPLEIYEADDDSLQPKTGNGFNYVHKDWAMSVTYKNAIAAILKGSGRPLSTQSILEMYARRTRATGSHGTPPRMLEVLQTSTCFVQNASGYWELHAEQQFWGDDAEHLFSSDKHIADDKADDIKYSFDLVITMFRKSCKVKHGDWSNDLDRAESRANDVYESWFSIFGRDNEKHTKISSADEWVYGSRYTFSYCGAYSSNRLLFDTDISRRADAAVARLLKRLDDAFFYSNERPRVLLLQTGLDGSTSANDSWGQIRRQWPNIDFHVTIVVPRDISLVFPEVFKMRGTTGWGHFEVERLDNLRRSNSTAAILQDPKHGRLIASLQDIEDLKRAHSLGLSKQRESLKIFTYAARLTYSKRNMFDLYSCVDRICSRCEGGTADVWYRGKLSPESLLCSDCYRELDEDDNVSTDADGSDSGADDDDSGADKKGDADAGGDDNGPSNNSTSRRDAPTSQKRSHANICTDANDTIVVRRKTTGAKADPLCDECGGPRTGIKTRSGCCNTCRNRRNRVNRAAKRLKAINTEEPCTNCGNPRTGTQAYSGLCGRCYQRQYVTKRVEANKDRGPCVDCGGPRTGQSSYNGYCTACYNRRRRAKREEANKSAGPCANCGGPRTGPKAHNGYCSKCYCHQYYLKKKAAKEASKEQLEEVESEPGSGSEDENVGSESDSGSEYEDIFQATDL